MPITVVQAAPVTHLASLTGPVTATFPGATAAGNTIVVLVTTNGDDANPVVAGVTLGGSAGSFTRAARNTALVQFGAEAWYDPGCAGGQTVVAVTCSGGSGTTPDIYVSAYEVSGILIADQSSFNDVHGAVTTWTSNATPATTQAAEVFAGVAMSGAAPTVTGAGTWATQGLTATFGVTSGYQIVSATGTATFSGTIPAGSYSALVATFFAFVPLVLHPGSAAITPAGANAAALAITVGGPPATAGAGSTAANAIPGRAVPARFVPALPLGISSPAGVAIGGAAITAAGPGAAFVTITQPP